MPTDNKLAEAYERFDAANSEDPNTETYQGKTYPKEVLYAMRMTEKLGQFAPDASDALKLTARCQHIRRWEIPRKSYEMNRAGYLRWRQELKRFHAQTATDILKEVGYDAETIEKVAFLLQKKQLKKNEETQTLEDVICLVFLEHYFEDFAQRHPEDKLIDILKKTWQKMSKKGQEAALQLPLSEDTVRLVTKAIETA
ncbi:DUF4202 domain-containing protein [Pseudozobellia thermophila]|uniref:DUF4202 domain-containing protein n=1 Tax=Pseudozobellia thermophila TaxID=192903 RepID=A0A1M6FS21_9FLAO|nr:DUF4202 domain-containing protein [Pseudozobellia thermophila]SHJ00487.1 protein of unknown function [Pseudozobellia thermophila]